MSANVYTPLPDGRQGVVSPHAFRHLWFSYLLEADGTLVGNSAQAHDTQAEAQARIDALK